MAKYLLIESRDPFDSADVQHNLQLAQDLAAHGNQVTLFLVQNGVLPSRPNQHSAQLATVAKAGVTILADDFSLRERGIDAQRLCNGVSAAALDTVVDAMAEGCKTIWH